VGKSGQLLEKLARRVGMDSAGSFITNTVLCRPSDNNATPTLKAVKTCTNEHLYPLLEKLQPRLIVALGNVAWKALRPVDAGEKKITEAHGNFYWSDTFNCYILPAFHPAAALRDASKIKQLQSDLAMAQRMLNGELDPSRIDAVPWALVSTYEVWEELRDKLRKEKRWAFDCETTGLDWKKDSITGISFGFPDKAYFLPVYPTSLHAELDDPFYRKVMGDFEVKEILQGVFGNTSILKVAHNAKFDVHFIEKWLGIEVV
jgi:uracil-DNA glycosylase family 4